ncbi:MAG: N-acetyl-D-myo-inosityl-2-amino-2-deoxy-alpha-D-glucopyranoside deacetylase MshB [Actinomycetia bacterium]|jgi:N-acetyl-1-D-myo-inositol-2-amino-2-deoxy-alpha-D-glucopyranoside deacetylase|nr:N-acetyl-D-myo-inosityl-2-amino-2-deoxy-alpha-D-glucopyranoside deacetylase MshB [Actinomycetes bacterium]MDQ1651972.1 N-acetyl-D-myo-inositol-2-amino-2-deoxy-alpha-D-glucopyranoside deacetylase [Cryptosporangiaceae bacterium]
MLADMTAPGRRLLLVHAHPDDEVIGTGATMARYAAEGAAVTLVTCTLGEEGEVLVPDLAMLAADQADQLGGYRIGELERSCAALGITDHRFLGGVGRYRDSGMMGEPSNDKPRAFWQADLREAAEQLVAVIRELRPQVLITYDANGFYGHPDHIQAHRVAMLGAELAADPSVLPDSGEPWQIAKVYWTAIPKSALQQGIDHFAESENNPFGGVTSAEDLPFGSADKDITARIDSARFIEHKIAAMRAHATQIAADNWLFFLAGNADGSFGSEHFTLVRGDRGPGSGEYDWETDLFAGL